MSSGKRVSRRLVKTGTSTTTTVATTETVAVQSTSSSSTRKIAPIGRARKAVSATVVKEEVGVIKRELNVVELPIVAPIAALAQGDDLARLEMEMEAEVERVKKKRKAPAKSRAKQEPKPKGVKAKKEPKPKKERKPKKPPVVVDVADSCPTKVTDRLKRVLSQRMFLVDRDRDHWQLRETFSMLGSTGNVYTVTIAPHRNACNCPDARTNNPCKHLLFIFVKVLHIPTTSTLVYQTSFTPAQLQTIFDSAPPAPSDVLVDPKLRAAFRGDIIPEEGSAGAAATAPDGIPLRREPVEGDDCPVCYSEMEADEALEYCEALGGCGRPLHVECFQMWSQTNRTKGHDVTCVWCRTPWEGAAAAANNNGKGRALVIPGASTQTDFYRSYTNMAALAGMSTKRDTSSYRR